MRRIIRRPSLIYPAGVRPGFDPQHPVAGTIRPGYGFSGVAVPGNFLNLLTGQPATITNTAPVSGFEKSLGRYTRGAANDTQMRFAGNSTGIGSGYTVAAIVSVTTLAYNKAIFHNCGDANNGYVLDLTDTRFRLVSANWDYLTGTGGTVLTNTPYFVCCTVSPGTPSSVDYFWRNLLTGEIYYERLSRNVFSTSPLDGTYQVACQTNAAFYSNNINLAAVMCAFERTPVDRIFAWSDDPWSFWYPPRPSARVGTSAFRARQYVQSYAIQRASTW